MESRTVRKAWITMIRKSPEIVNMDKQLFEDWENGVIEIWEAIKLFKLNNGIEDPIDSRDFESWLNSLGYWRIDI